MCCFAGFFQTKPKQAWWRRRYGKVRAIQAKGYTILHSEREQNESCNYECAWPCLVQCTVCRPYGSEKTVRFWYSLKSFANQNLVKSQSDCHKKITHRFERGFVCVTTPWFDKIFKVNYHTWVCKGFLSMTTQWFDKIFMEIFGFEIQKCCKLCSLYISYL